MPLVALTDSCVTLKIAACYGNHCGFLDYSDPTVRYWNLDCSWEAYEYDISGDVIGHCTGTISKVYDPATGSVTTTTTGPVLIVGAEAFGFPWSDPGLLPASSGAWTYTGSGASATASYDQTTDGVRITTVSTVTLSTPYTLSQAEADLDTILNAFDPSTVATDTITYLAPKYGGAIATQNFDSSVDYSLAGFGTVNSPTAITPDSPYTSGTNPEYSVAWSVFMQNLGGLEADFVKANGYITMAGDLATKTYWQTHTDPMPDPAPDPYRNSCAVTTGYCNSTPLEIKPTTIVSCQSNGIQSFVTVTPGGNCS